MAHRLQKLQLTMFFLFRRRVLVQSALPDTYRSDVLSLASSRGAKRNECFGDREEDEEMCCAGGGLSFCFDEEFTLESCCNANWDHWSPRPRVRLAFEAQKFAHDNAGMDLQARVPLYLMYVFKRLGLEGDCVEIGVQKGIFSKAFLQADNELRGSSIRHYYMVDVWKQAADVWYQDEANVENFQQASNLKEAATAITHYWDKASIIQLPSSAAAQIFSEEQLSFIFLDARHDYCSVMEELQLYWPKLKPGGLMSGDDYKETTEYAYCENGSHMPGGVKRAVDEWRMRQALGLAIWGGAWWVVKPGPATLDETLLSTNA